MNKTPATTIAPKTALFDRTAICLSGLCLLHCLAVPLLVGALPALLPLADERLHTQLLLLVVPLSLIALCFGYARHRSARIAACIVTGLLLLGVGATLADALFGEGGERACTVAGALILAIGHFFNTALARRNHLPDQHAA